MGNGGRKVKARRKGRAELKWCRSRGKEKQKRWKGRKKDPGGIEQTRDGRLRSWSTGVEPGFLSSTGLDAKPGLNPAHEHWSRPSLVWMRENSSSKFQTHRKVLLSTPVARPAVSRPHWANVNESNKKKARSLPAVNGTSTYPSKNSLLYFFFCTVA